MGLIRSIAKKALHKVTGKADEARPAAPPAPPPKATAAPAPSPTPAPAAPPPAPPAPAAAAPAPAPAPAAPAPSAPVSDEAERFATLNAGAQEIKERMEAGEPVLLLDVREPFETAAGILPGAVLIPMGQLPSRWKELQNADEIVCYCASGVRSVAAATFLRERGLFNATSLEGGISEWMSLGGKVVRPG